MHIPDGIASTPVLVVAGGVAVAGVGYGIRRLRHDEIPKVAVLTSCFFVASLIHVPLPPVSVHLVLPGLLGALLGWGAFPAVFVGLLMQYLFFGFGGITSIGINVCTMAIPAVTCRYAFGWLLSRGASKVFLAGFLSGGFGVCMSCLLYSSALFLSGSAYFSIAAASLLFHLPIIVIEAFITAFALSYLHQVRPESLRLSSVDSAVSLESAV